MHIYTPYTYRISWSALKKSYYGVRYSKKCHPDDLWKTYFTSSKTVKEYRKLYGEPDIIEVRRTFTDAHSAKIWETKVLRRLDVLNSKFWLNKNIGGDQYIIEKHSEKTKRLMSINNGMKKPEVAAHISARQTGSGNSFYGKKHTHESNMARRAKLIGRPKPSRPPVTCPHCGLTTKNRSNAARYHFDKCKLSPNFGLNPVLDGVTITPVGPGLSF